MTRAPAPQLSILGTVLTHTGLVRAVNEDAVVYLPPEALDGGALAVVTDGMGGHPAGDVASRIAAETVLQTYRTERSLPPPQRLARCLAAADAAIWRRGTADPACAGMGTTCTILALEAGAAFLGHIGDSRAYRLRGGRLRQLSDDHSVVGELVRAGAVTPEEARRRPDRHLILRALGIVSEIMPQVWPKGLAIRAGDVFILCSDGLSDMVEDAAIARLVRGRAPEEACRALVEAALAAGGRDNVSVAIVAVGG